MEKDKKIRELLGLKQEDMALLLRVTRSQWAMYEIGKRDLPIVAQLKLGEMLAFIQQPKNAAVDSFLDLKSEEAKTRKVFENLKLINKHRQILTEHKLKAIEKKYEAGITALRFIHFLETQDQQIVPEQEMVLTVLKVKAEAAIRKNGLTLQAKYQFKLKSLLQEEELLNEMVQE
jgi:transcriptional regulator with XRE-family HTH domain